jgi:hypothetical protein
VAVGRRRPFLGGASAWLSQLASALLLVFGLACSDAPEPRPASGESTAETAPTPDLSDVGDGALSEAQQIEQLSAIGYLAGTQPARDSQGVVAHDPGRTALGANLMTSGHGPVALLFDMNGVVLHEWRAEFSEVFPAHPKFPRVKEPQLNFWRDAALLSNGAILVIWEPFGLFELDRDSRVRWVVPEPAHHDLHITESGEIVHLQAERMMIPGIPEKPAIEDFIVTRDSRGTELRRLAMSDALRNVHWQRLRKRFWDRGKERGYKLSEKHVFDPFHTNSLWLLSEAEAARLGAPFRAGDALVSMSMLDTIAILDMEEGVARWSQQGPFGMQHAPRPSLDGGITLFNNFLTAERSSVVTLDPRLRRVTREYTGPKEAPLFSRRSGRIQVLANGNTLVVETDGGRALEVTEGGEVVWEYHSPFRAGDSRDKVAGLYSLERVAPSRISWLNPERAAHHRTP